MYPIKSFHYSKMIILQNIQRLVWKNFIPFVAQIMWWCYFCFWFRSMNGLFTTKCTSIHRDVKTGASLIWNALFLHIKFSLWPLPPPHDGNPRLLGYYIQFLHWGPMYIYIYIYLQFVYHVLLVYVNVPYLVFDFINTFQYFNMELFEY